jgi:hypothetical protein
LLALGHVVHKGGGRHAAVAQRAERLHVHVAVIG